jgi:hypothetical protein
MSSTNSPDAAARENIGDGQDSIREALKSVKRVLRSHPTLESALSQATTQLRAADESLCKARELLPKE